MTRAAQENRERRRHGLTGAHTTRPIESTEMVRRWLDIAKEHDKNAPARGGASWYLLLVIGFNTGLRISDIIPLRVEDIRGREYLTTIEAKTDKERRVFIRRDVGKRIDELLDGMDPLAYVLPSRKKDPATGEPRHISRQRAYAIIREIARRSGYTDHVGCHTMRKTYAWSLFDASGDNIVLVMKALNHSSQAATMRYLGIDQKDIDEAAARMRRML
ncbi:MAG: tyrosine-type recombinase/integrase [Oscillospiraceae bacterium]|nr:tyrosine-type recombinase/integrase [Oscillospiraceae bacterium]